MARIIISYRLNTTNLRLRAFLWENDIFGAHYLKLPEPSAVIIFQKQRVDPFTWL